MSKWVLKYALFLQEESGDLNYNEFDADIDLFDTEAEANQAIEWRESMKEAD